MIDPSALNSLCFPWVLLDEKGSMIKAGDGALFKPPYSNIDAVVAIASNLDIGSWAICPNGFAIYRFFSPVLSPGSIALHGLKIDGLSKARGRTAGLSINVGQSDIHSYVNQYCAALSAMDGQYKSIIRQNIHEVRGINSALYNAAYELQEILEGDYPHRGTSISRSVVSLSELLRGRIDFMEFIANPNTGNVRKSDVKVYKKFDKVQRCFRVTASKRGIEFEIGGSSSRTTFGPLPIFDLIPYLLLDNAVKYSPDISPVKILCNDTERFINCSVTSKGPRIVDDELEQIFASGFRGTNALKSKKEGTGLGLSVLRKVVVDVFNGTIQVAQGQDDLLINGIPYCDVTFELKLPVSQEKNPH
jgi:signal transduction histidine kinase